MPGPIFAERPYLASPKTQFSSSFLSPFLPYFRSPPAHFNSLHPYPQTSKIKHTTR